MFKTAVAVFAKTALAVFETALAVVKTALQFQTTALRFLLENCIAGTETASHFFAKRRCRAQGTAWQSFPKWEFSQELARHMDLS